LLNEVGELLWCTAEGFLRRFHQLVTGRSVRKSLPLPLVAIERASGSVSEICLSSLAII
jgi:hypothetical protein